MDGLHRYRGIVIDRLVNGRVERDNLLNVTHVVTEAVDEGGVLAKELSKLGRLEAVPGLLKFFGYFLGSLHRIIVFQTQIDDATPFIACSEALVKTSSK